MKTHNLAPHFTLATMAATSLIATSQALAAPCTQNKSIVSVYTTSDASKEYVIFKVKRPSSSYVVPYTVNSVTGPFSDGASGNPIAVNGMAFKRIDFTSTFWMCSIHENLASLPRTTVIDVKKQEQFEGQIHYIVGYKNAPPPKNYLSSYQYNAGTFKKVVMAFKK